jgi:hypothetical protein
MHAYIMFFFGGFHAYITCQRKTSRCCRFHTVVYFNDVLTCNHSLFSSFPLGLLLPFSINEVLLLA